MNQLELPRIVLELIDGKLYIYRPEKGKTDAVIVSPETLERWAISVWRRESI